MPQWVNADVIGIVVTLLIMFGAAIGNFLKQSREKREAIRRQQERREQTELRTQLPRGEASAAPASLDDVAARRREQLRELARQRQQASSTPPTAPQRPQHAPAGSADPTNLTMAERVTRARAKAQYEQRAQEMRSQQAEAARRQGEVAQRQRDDTRQRTERDTRRQREARERATRAEEEARRRAAQRQPLAQPRREEQAAPAVTAAVQLAAMERTADAAYRMQPGGTAPRARGAAAGALAFNATSLRQAFILKELLDPPLSMRDAAAGSQL